MESIEQVLEIAARRRWWAIIPFLLVILAGLAYGLWAPRLYEAETLILVQPQKVPEAFVQPIITGGVEDRLKSITQQVTSRTNLEKIIRENGLYDKHSNGLSLDRKVAILRANLVSEVSYPDRRSGSEANAFIIKFCYEDPVKARDVVNALASKFISENLKMRESQAAGTAEFISEELGSVQKQLVQKEEKLGRYRERYIGGLPEQLEANLSTLERLQEHLNQLKVDLRDQEYRRYTIQAQRTAQTGSAGVSGDPLQLPGDLYSLKNELVSLEARYTPNHPEVIRLKEFISRLETEPSIEAGDSAEREPAVETGDRLSEGPLQNIALEIENDKAEIKRIEAQIELYQSRVADTPKREQELFTLNRDHENLKEVYQLLLMRKLEAKIAISMEKKQKAEKFRIVDPAKIPTIPVKPDLRKMILLTLVLGLGAGFGTVYLVETRDPSYKLSKEVEADLNVPVLMRMPIRYTEKQLRSIKKKQILITTLVTVCFILSVAGIIIAFKGTEGTLSLLINLKETVIGM